MSDELQDLVNLPDDQIDTSDIPEVTDWSKAVRGKFKRIKTAFWADLMGAGGKTPQEEMEQQREWVEEELGVKLDIHMPYHVGQIEQGTDLVLFDYGGMTLGNSLMEDNSRRLIKWAEDHPSALVVIISTFTYDQGVRHEIAEHLGLDSVPYHYGVPDEDKGTTPIHNMTIAGYKNTYPDWFRQAHGCAAQGEYHNISKLEPPDDKPVKRSGKPTPQLADALFEAQRKDPLRLMRVQAVVAAMNKRGEAALPAQTFFEPKKNFLDFMKKKFRLRYVYDVGAGMGHVAVALRKAGVKKVNAIDLFPRDGAVKVVHGNGVDYPYKSHSLVMLCRPCHGQFVESVIQRAIERKADIMYVGLAKNVKGDLGGYYRKFKKVLSNVGADKENVWLYQGK